MSAAQAKRASRKRKYRRTQSYIVCLSLSTRLAYILWNKAYTWSPDWERVVTMIIVIVVIIILNLHLQLAM